MRLCLNVPTQNIRNGFRTKKYGEVLSKSPSWQVSIIVRLLRLILRIWHTLFSDKDKGLFREYTCSTLVSIMTFVPRTCLKKLNSRRIKRSLSLMISLRLNKPFALLETFNRGNSSQMCQSLRYSAEYALQGLSVRKMHRSMLQRQGTLISCKQIDFFLTNFANYKYK